PRHAFCSRDLIEELNLLLSQLEAYRCVSENSLALSSLRVVMLGKYGHLECSSAVYGRIPALHKCSVMCTFTVVYLHDPIRGGVSKFFRCEAPFLHHHEIEWTIMPSLRAQKPWTPARPQASLSAAPSHHCSGLFAHAKRGQPAWRVPSSGSLGSRGPLKRHS